MKLREFFELLRVSREEGAAWFLSEKGAVRTLLFGEEYCPLTFACLLLKEPLELDIAHYHRAGRACGFEPVETLRLVDAIDNVGGHDVFLRDQLEEALCPLPEEPKPSQPLFAVCPTAP